MVCGEPTLLERFEPCFNSLLPDCAIAFRSEPFYLEVVPRGIDKAACLQHILNRLSLTPANLIACGDGYNDISMIRFAGLGVAMENANDAVKQVADSITLSNEADGIAVLVKSLLLA